LNVIDL